MKQLLASAVWLCMALPGATLMAQNDRDNPLSARAFDRVTSKSFSGNYWLYLPPDYEDRKDDAFPLVLFLHGAGERGDDLKLVAKHGPPKHVAAGKEYPFILVAPQCPQGRWWDVGMLSALLDEIEATHRVDPDRIYVTGLSMGGFGSFYLAIEEPDRFAAIAPVCGGGERFMARQIRHLPVWAFHGGADPVVPVARSREMIETLERLGNEHTRLTVYKGVGHNSWVRVYNDPRVFEWLLANKRGEPMAPPKGAEE